MPFPTVQMPNGRKHCTNAHFFFPFALLLGAGVDEATLLALELAVLPLTSSSCLFCVIWSVLTRVNSGTSAYLARWCLLLLLGWQFVLF